jgi:Tol biopolymer transport system component
MFYLSSQPNPDDNSVYVIQIQPNAQAEKIAWFGAWRWRDANSVYYIPFELNNPTQQLMYYNLETKEAVLLTNPISHPFAVMNGQWSVNADGSKIVFRNSLDRNLWVMMITAQ